MWLLGWTAVLPHTEYRSGARINQLFWKVAGVSTSNPPLHDTSLVPLGVSRLLDAPRAFPHLSELRPHTTGLYRHHDGLYGADLLIADSLRRKGHGSCPVRFRVSIGVLQ